MRKYSANSRLFLLIFIQEKRIYHLYLVQGEFPTFGLLYYSVFSPPIRSARLSQLHKFPTKLD